MKMLPTSLAKIAMVLLLASLLTACHRAEVPPAYVGKLSTSSGLQEGTIPPSKIKMNAFPFCLSCDTLILAEASDHGFKESMEVFMPKDQLNLNVEVRGVAAISSDDTNVEKIFDRITAQADPNDDRVRTISMQKVFTTYGEPIIREATRTVVTQYSIAQVMENRDAISQELAKVIREKLSTSPLTVNQFGLADIQPPQVIVIAQETRKEREIEIERAEAEKQVALKRAEAALEVAMKQQEVDLKEAETQVLVNQKLSEGVNEAFVAQRSLKVLDALANNENTVFFLPMEAMKNPALLMGMTIEGFKGIPAKNQPAVQTAESTQPATAAAVQNQR